MDMAAALHQFNQDGLKRSLAQAIEDGDELLAAQIRKQLDDAEQARKETR